LRTPFPGAGGTGKRTRPRRRAELASARGPYSGPKALDPPTPPSGVDYQRAYWLIFTACGLLLVVGEVPTLLAGRVSVGPGLSLLLGGVVAVGGAYALGRGEERGAPDSLNLRFGMVVVAFLLLLLDTGLGLLLG